VSSPPETERTGPRQEAGPTITSTGPDDTASEDWRVRLADQRADWLRRRAAERALRAEQQARRTASKALLHGRRRRGGR
jgi:fructosamine-3-kinase